MINSALDIKTLRLVVTVQAESEKSGTIRRQVRACPRANKSSDLRAFSLATNYYKPIISNIVQCS